MVNLGNKCVEINFLVGYNFENPVYLLGLITTLKNNTTHV